MSEYFKFLTPEYIAAVKRAKIIRELGEAVMEENGEKACIEMLEAFKKVKAEKHNSKGK